MTLALSQTLCRLDEPQSRGIESAYFSNPIFLEKPSFRSIPGKDAKEAERTLNLFIPSFLSDLSNGLNHRCSKVRQEN